MWLITWYSINIGYMCMGDCILFPQQNKGKMLLSKRLRLNISWIWKKKVNLFSDMYDEYGIVKMNVLKNVYWNTSSYQALIIYVSDTV